MYIQYGVLVVLGVVLFTVGMGMVMNETAYHDQVPGMSVSITGSVLIAAAGIQFLILARQALTTRQVSVFGIAPRIVDAIPAVSAPASSAVLVGADGLLHYHRADCVMALGRAWTALDRARHEGAGRRPCGVCNP